MAKETLKKLGVPTPKEIRGETETITPSEQGWSGTFKKETEKGKKK